MTESVAEEEALLAANFKTGIRFTRDVSTAEIYLMAFDRSKVPLKGKELHEATRLFARESRFQSWWYTGSTFIFLISVLAAAGVSTWWPARLAWSILGGLLLVRAFVLYHDFMHGAILKKSKLGKLLFYVYGLAALTPPRSWRHSHNFHHAHVGKPIPEEKGEFSFFTSEIGAVPLMTTDMWRQASFWQRAYYRICRHPVTIMAAYVTVFFIGTCLFPLLRDPRRYWDGALSLLVHGGTIASIWIFFGFSTAFFAFLLPFSVAAACGAYLFFAQHNFEGLGILSIGEWSHFEAAMESSSYIKLGPLMQWFTGNVGYHDVHHLNSMIPFYRLPETVAAIKELQNPIVTTLWPRDVLTCLNLSLWDKQSQKLVSFRAFSKMEKERE